MKKQRLEQEIQKALKENQKARLSALRLFKAELQNEELQNRESATDEVVEVIAAKIVRQMQRALETAPTQENQDLFEVAKEFLPRQLTTQELLYEIVARRIDVEHQESKGEFYGLLKREFGASVSNEVLAEAANLYYSWL